MKKFIHCYLIAMPIGDELGDISFKTLEVINKVNFIFCESLEILKRLNKKYDINFNNKKIIKLIHPDEEIKTLKFIKYLIRKNYNFAIISDSGVPCFFDPGAEIVNFLLKKYSNEVKFFPVGVSSSLDAVLILLGKYCSSGFMFCGFLNCKGNSKKFNIDIEHKITISLDNDLPAIFFIDYLNLNNAVDILEKNKFSGKVFIASNLGKKEILEKQDQVYKILFGKIEEIKVKLNIINKNDDIILCLISG